MHLLQLIDDGRLIHLLHLLLLHDVSNVIDYARSWVFVSEAIILLISSLGLLLFLVHLLQSLETEVHKFYGLVYVRLCNSVSELELGHWLRDSNDGKQRSRSYIHVTHLLLAFSLEFSLFNISCHNILVQIVWDNWIECLCLSNERTHDLGIYLIIVRDRSIQLLMNLCDMLCQPFIHFSVSLI